MENINVEMVGAIREQAFARLMDLSTALIDASIGTDGATFGDSPLGRGDRILRFQDLAQRGVLDVLQTISAPTYELLVRNYLRDVAASPIVKGVRDGRS